MTVCPPGLLAPAGSEQVPDFDRGWISRSGARAPFLSYTNGDLEVNWSEELELLHEESSRDHFIDRYTRNSMLAALGELSPQATVADIGCSSGYLLHDLDTRFPDATLIGVDMIASGLRKAHALVPRARLLRADACDLPIEDAALDAVVSANLLEHIPNDRRALSEIRRVLRPSGVAVVVVPTGASTYDYYDRFMGHERRYRRGEIAAKARAVGLQVAADVRLGSLLYPPFWLVKQRNRRCFDASAGETLQQRVARDISGTKDSPLGAWTCAAERRLRNLGVNFPFGIRGLTVLHRAEAIW